MSLLSYFYKCKKDGKGTQGRAPVPFTSIYWEGIMCLLCFGHGRASWRVTPILSFKELAGPWGRESLRQYKAKYQVPIWPGHLSAVMLMSSCSESDLFWNLALLFYLLCNCEHVILPPEDSVSITVNCDNSIYNTMGRSQQILYVRRLAYDQHGPRIMKAKESPQWVDGSWPSLHRVGSSGSPWLFRAYSFLL